MSAAQLRVISEASAAAAVPPAAGAVMQVTAQYHREQVPEDLLDRFEQEGVSDELFEQWHELVSCIFCADAGAVPLSQAIRNVAVQCIERIAKGSGSSWSSFFLGAAIFDAVCVRRGVTVEDMPAVCAAVAGLMRKEDDATACVNYEVLAWQASELAQWLRITGHPSVMADVTVDQIFGRESEILDAVGWVVELPTVEGWASSMVGRLHILTQDRYAEAIQMMWPTLVQCMRVVVLKEMASIEFTTWELACGLLGLGLRGVRLLPAEALKAESSDGVCHRLLASHHPALAPLLRAEECDLLRQLAGAAGCDVAAVCASCEKVARLLQEIAAETGRTRSPALELQRASV